MNDNQFWFLMLSAASILLLCINLLLFKFDIQSPPIATGVSLSVASTLCLIMVNKWVLPMHGSTVFILLLAQIVITIVTGFVAYTTTNNKDIDNIRYYDIYIPKTRQIIIWLLLMVLVALGAKESYELSLQAGNTNGISGIVTTLRPHFMKEDGEFQFSRWMTYYQLIIQQITYVSIFAGINRLFRNNKNKLDLLYFIPVIFYFIFIFFSTG